MIHFVTKLRHPILEIRGFLKLYGILSFQISGSIAQRKKISVSEGCTQVNSVIEYPKFDRNTTCLISKNSENTKDPKSILQPRDAGYGYRTKMRRFR